MASPAGRGAFVADGMGLALGLVQKWDTPLSLWLITIIIIPHDMLFVSIEWSLEPKKHRFRNSCPCNEASMLPSPAPAAGKPAPQRTQPTQAAANVTPK